MRPTMHLRTRLVLAAAASLGLVAARWSIAAADRIGPFSLATFVLEVMAVAAVVLDAALATGQADRPSRLARPASGETRRSAAVWLVIDCADIGATGDAISAAARVSDRVTVFDATGDIRVEAIARDHGASCHALTPATSRRTLGEAVDRLGDGVVLVARDHVVLAPTEVARVVVDLVESAAAATVVPPPPSWCRSSTDSHVALGGLHPRITLLVRAGALRAALQGQSRARPDNLPARLAISLVTSGARVRTAAPVFAAARPPVLVRDSALQRCSERGSLTLRALAVRSLLASLVPVSVAAVTCAPLVVALRSGPTTASVFAQSCLLVAGVVLRRGLAPRQRVVPVLRLPALWLGARLWNTMAIAVQLAALAVVASRSLAGELSAASGTVVGALAVALLVGLAADRARIERDDPKAELGEVTVWAEGAMVIRRAEVAT